MQPFCFDTTLLGIEGLTNVRGGLYSGCASGTDRYKEPLLSCYANSLFASFPNIIPITAFTGKFWNSPEWRDTVQPVWVNQRMAAIIAGAGLTDPLDAIGVPLDAAQRPGP